MKEIKVTILFLLHVSNVASAQENVTRDGESIPQNTGTTTNFLLSMKLTMMISGCGR